MRLLVPASWAACAREVKCSNSQHEPTGMQTGFCVCSVTGMGCFPGNRGFHTDDRQQDIDTDEPSNRSALHPLIKSKMRRDGGTGRRSGLKIRRASARGGSTPPPGTTLESLRYKKSARHFGGLIFAWCMFWCMFVKQLWMKCSFSVAFSARC